jgi:hypothetical protein
MHRTWSFIPGIVVLCLLEAASTEAQTALRWQFRPGEAYQLTINQDVTMSGIVAAQATESTINQVYDAVWTVSQVDRQGVAEVVLQIKRARMTFSGPVGMRAQFDSAATAPPQGIAAMFGPSLKALTNGPLRLKLSPRGEVLEFEVPQAVLDGLKGSPIAAQMGSAPTKDRLLQMIKQSLPLLPDRAVQKDDTWTDSANYELPGLGKMSTHTELVYAGPEYVDGKPLERIDLKAEMKLAPVPAQGSLSVTMKDPVARGAVFFDNVASRLSHSELTQNMTFVITVGVESTEQKMSRKTVARMTAKPL